MQHAHIQALFIDVFDKVMTNISVILSNIFKKYITEQNIDQHGILRVCKTSINIVKQTRISNVSDSLGQIQWGMAMCWAGTILKTDIWFCLK